MRVTNLKSCKCLTCQKNFHYLGIARHRAMHRSKMENCTISYTHGDTYFHAYANTQGRDYEIHKAT